MQKENLTVKFSSVFIFCIGVILIYYPQANYFIASDGYWLNRASILTFKNITGLNEINYLRALPVVYFHFAQKLWGLNSFYFYFFNIILHLLNCFLLYKITFLICEIFSLNNKKQISYLSTVVFAFFYPHYQAILWIACVTDLMVAFFMFSTMFFFLKFLQQEKLFYFVMANIFFIFSLSTKELAFILPLLLGSFLFFSNKKRFTFLVPLLILDLIYFSVYYKYYLPLSKLPAVFSLKYYLNTYYYFFIDLLGKWLGFDTQTIENYFLISPKVVLPWIGVIQLFIIIFLILIIIGKIKIILLPQKFNKNLLLFILLAILITFLPSVFSPEVNNRHSILSNSRYFYFPSAMISFALSYIFLRAYSPNVLRALLIFLIFIIYSNIYSISLKKNTYTNIANNTKNLVYLIKNRCQQNSFKTIILSNFPPPIQAFYFDILPDFLKIETKQGFQVYWINNLSKANKELAKNSCVVPWLNEK